MQPLCCLMHCFTFEKNFYRTLVFILSKPHSFPLAGPIHSKVVVCYIGTWSVYRPAAGSFSLDNFDPSLCTHVIYSFAGLDEAKDTIKSLGKLIKTYFFHRNSNSQSLQIPGKTWKTTTEKEDMSS